MTAIVGSGGVSKSMLMVAYAIALALGEQYHRMIPRCPCRVVLYNVEDDDDEQQRRLSAVLTSMGRSPADIADKIMRTGPTKAGTLLARYPETRAIYQTDAMREMIANARAFEADVLILDPMAELHTEDENANVALREVVAEFRAVAKDLDVALVLVHHTRKGVTVPGDMDAARGASSVVSAARVGLTVVAMTEDDAVALGMTADAHRHYFRLDGGKSNYSPLTGLEWFERVTFSLDQGDTVGVPRPWSPPSDAVSLDTRLAIHAAAAIGSPDGPWSIRLSSDTRSIRHLLIKHGVTTAPGQRAAVKDLEDAGFRNIDYRRTNRGSGKGLRSPDGQPSNVDWLDEAIP